MASSTHVAHAALPVQLPGSDMSPVSSVKQRRRDDELVPQTPRKMRRTLSAVYGGPRLSSTLPSFDKVTVADLVRHHAAHMWKESGFPAVLKRKRARVKQPLPKDRLLWALVEDPMRRASGLCPSWTARRDACWFIGSLIKSHLHMPVALARSKAAQLWKDAGSDVKHNAHALFQAFGLPEKVPLARLAAAEAPQHVIGGMFTWQTSWGRNHDLVGKLLAVGAAFDDIEDIMAHDSEFGCYFDGFMDWISDMCDAHGLECWSACLELNSQDARKARVHAHAYVCRHWKHWGSDTWTPVSITPAQWMWDGVKPHFVSAKVKGNANPQKVLAGGLYYVCAPKLGSVMRQCSLTLYKATSNPPSQASHKSAGALMRASQLAASPHPRVPTHQDRRAFKTVHAVLCIALFVSVYEFMVRVLGPEPDS